MTKVSIEDQADAVGRLLRLAEPALRTLSKRGKLPDAETIIDGVQAATQSLEFLRKHQDAIKRIAR